MMQEHEEQQELFSLSSILALPKKKKVNPCIALYGNGPEGVKCGTCVHLYVKRYANKYYKCGLRTSGGLATDHRVNWPACGKYEEAGEEKAER